MSDMKHTDTDYYIHYYIEDLENIARLIDDVLPAGKASRYTHYLIGVWRARRDNFEDKANADYIKYKETNND